MIQYFIRLTPDSVRSHFSRYDLIWLPVVVAALLAIYLPGLGNSLVFDDAYLSDGLFSDYRYLSELRVRMLSYGSFVQLQALFGEGWWKQRLVNLAIHMCVVVVLWGLYREILRAIAAQPADSASPQAAAIPYDKSPALGFAIGFFALNPVAVYSVGYLIQRSILLATFFVVAGLGLFARAISTKKPWLFAAAFACYLPAVGSKETAVSAPPAAIPLYNLIAGPGAKRIASLAGVGAIIVAAAGYVLWRWYGDILFKPFDEYSHVYLAQLN